MQIYDYPVVYYLVEESKFCALAMEIIYIYIFKA